MVAQTLALWITFWYSYGMANGKNLVFFDFDGVIVNTYDMSFDIARILNPQLGSALNDEKYRRYFEGNIHEEIAKEKLRQKNDVTDFFSEYDRRLHAHHRPGDMMDTVIRELASRYALFVISSTPTAIIKKFFAAHELESCFKGILGSDVHTSKTKKIERVLAERHAAPGDCVFITDTLGDIREAEAAGVQSIAVTWGYHPRETLERGKPIAIAEDPRELVSCIDRYLQPPTPACR